MNIRELLDKRATLLHEARGILDAAEAESRQLTGDEEERWSKLMDEANELSERIDRYQRQMAAEQALAASPTVATLGDGNRALPQFVSRGLREIGEDTPELFEEPLWRQLFRYADDGYRSLFRKALRNGMMLDPRMVREARDLTAAEDIYGGYLVAPMQFVDRLIQAVDNLVYMRQWGSVFAVPNAESLGAVSLDNDPADPTWTSELNIGSEDSTMSFGRRELKPNPLAQYIKLSRTLLRKVPDVEGLVRGRLAYKTAVVQENAFLNGSGVGEPLGVFVASDSGISTSRDASTGNETTSIKFDGLIEAKYTLKTQYWPRARWLFHRDGVKQIAKLKDGEGQYLWRESVRVGEPDRILGLPVFMSEYAPNTFTTALYVGILGDFSYYWIADSLMMEVQRLVELYAGNNQVGMIVRSETDGMPVLAEAFVRVKLA